MPIVVPKKPQSALNGTSFMEKVGVAKALTQELEAQGWAVKLTATALTIEKGEQKYSHPVVLADLHLIAGGQGADAAAKYWVALTSLANDVLGYVPPVASPDILNDVFGEAYLATIAHKDPAKPTTKPAKPDVVETVSSGKWPCFQLDSMLTAPTVKLREATAMYQPVLGTSGTSRYFVVAANKDLRVAARYTGASLSIRIEGPNWTKHLSAIQANGFDKASKEKDYASIHLTIGDETLAAKTLGAVLMGLGLSYETPLPVMKLIAGKGN